MTHSLLCVRYGLPLQLVSIADTLARQSLAAPSTTASSSLVLAQLAAKIVSTLQCIDDITSRSEAVLPLLEAALASLDKAVVSQLNEWQAAAVVDLPSDPTASSGELPMRWLVDAWIGLVELVWLDAVASERTIPALRAIEVAAALPASDSAGHAAPASCVLGAVQVLVWASQRSQDTSESSSIDVAYEMLSSWCASTALEVLRRIPAMLMGDQPIGLQHRPATGGEGAVSPPSLDVLEVWLCAYAQGLKSALESCSTGVEQSGDNEVHERCMSWLGGTLELVMHAHAVRMNNCGIDGSNRASAKDDQADADDAAVETSLAICDILCTFIVSQFAGSGEDGGGAILDRNDYHALLWPLTLALHTSCIRTARSIASAAASIQQAAPKQDWTAAIDAARTQFGNVLPRVPFGSSPEGLTLVSGLTAAWFQESGVARYFESKDAIWNRQSIDVMLGPASVLIARLQRVIQASFSSSTPLLSWLPSDTSVLVQHIAFWHATSHHPSAIENHRVVGDGPSDDWRQVAVQCAQHVLESEQAAAANGGNLSLWIVVFDSLHYVNMLRQIGAITGAITMTRSIVSSPQAEEYGAAKWKALAAAAADVLALSSDLEEALHSRRSAVAVPQRACAAYGEWTGAVESTIAMEGFVEDLHRQAMDYAEALRVQATRADTSDNITSQPAALRQKLDLLRETNATLLQRFKKWRRLPCWHYPPTTLAAPHHRPVAWVIGPGDSWQPSLSSCCVQLQPGAHARLDLEVLIFVPTTDVHLYDVIDPQLAVTLAQASGRRGHATCYGKLTPHSLSTAPSTAALALRMLHVGAAMTCVAAGIVSCSFAPAVALGEPYEFRDESGRGQADAEAVMEVRVGTTNTGRVPASRRSELSMRLAWLSQLDDAGGMELPVALATRNVGSGVHITDKLSWRVATAARAVDWLHVTRTPQQTAVNAPSLKSADSSTPMHRSSAGAAARRGSFSDMLPPAQRQKQ